jgi:hypothetical protein
MIFILSACLAPAKEPEYQGKTLSEWLVAMQADLSDEEEAAATRQSVDPAQLRNQKHEQAREAVRQMGTNAIPTLVDLLGVTDGNRWLVLRKLKSKELRSAIHAESAVNTVLSQMALDAFGILGTNAAPAIPQIVKLFNKVDTCSEAAQALALLGPEGVAALTNGLSSKNNDIRGITIWAIGEKSGMDSNTMMRIMIDQLKDPHSGHHAEAARYLGSKDPAVAIPALLPLLDDDYAYVVDYAARSLSSYGPAAKAAIPKLFTLYTNAAVQRDRTKISTISLMPALKAIDMEAARQAEEFLVNSGPLNEARNGYTRTKLTNGLELIAGGYVHTSIPTDTNRELSSAELLDPKTGKWTETGRLNFARYDHKATLLPDGKVLVKGGAKFSIVNIRQSFWEGNHLVERYAPATTRSDITTAELYDPTSGTWTVVTNK